MRRQCRSMAPLIAAGIAICRQPQAWANPGNSQLARGKSPQEIASGSPSASSPARISASSSSVTRRSAPGTGSLTFAQLAGDRDLTPGSSNAWTAAHSEEAS